jgi:hypothetical protein
MWDIRTSQTMQMGVLDSITHSSLEKFQRFFKLPVTGQFDGATKRIMERDRCGLRDFPEVAFQTRCPWNRRNLTFAFGPLTGQAVGGDAARSAVRSAFATWAAAGVGLQFTEVQTDQNPDIQIEWRPANDPDANMKGIALAHADFPPGCP